jgi:fucose permease
MSLESNSAIRMRQCRVSVSESSLQIRRLKRLNACLKVTSIYDIGCAVGCLIAFVFGHRLGRKNMIIAGGSIMVIGTVILGSSYSTAQFLVGRVVTGLGNGINSSTVPTYQSGK